MLPVKSMPPPEKRPDDIEMELRVSVCRSISRKSTDSEGREIQSDDMSCDLNKRHSDLEAKLGGTKKPQEKICPYCVWSAVEGKIGDRK